MNICSLVTKPGLSLNNTVIALTSCCSKQCKNYYKSLFYVYYKTTNTTIPIPSNIDIFKISEPVRQQYYYCHFAGVKNRHR